MLPPVNCTAQNIHIVFDSGPLVSLGENMMTSTVKGGPSHVHMYRKLGKIWNAWILPHDVLYRMTSC